MYNCINAPIRLCEIHQYNTNHACVNLILFIFYRAHTQMLPVCPQNREKHLKLKLI